MLWSLKWWILSLGKAPAIRSSDRMQRIHVVTFHVSYLSHHKPSANIRLSALRQVTVTFWVAFSIASFSLQSTPTVKSCLEGGGLKQCFSICFDKISDRARSLVVIKVFAKGTHPGSIPRAGRKMFFLHPELIGSSDCPCTALLHPIHFFQVSVTRALLSAHSSIHGALALCSNLS